jgi:GNAT superfamily N-acetyltransferase
MVGRPQEPGVGRRPVAGGLVRRTLPDGHEVDVGVLAPERTDELFAIFTDVVARGDGFPQLPPLTPSQFADIWLAPATLAVGAVVGGSLAGAYYLRPNLPGRGAHIANAGYVVARERRGRGIGRVLVEDSIERAAGAGFDAIQFNFVFSSNPARRLYEELGWVEIGRVPGGVGGHGGSVGEDAVLYWRAVGERSPDPDAE